MSRAQTSCIRAMAQTRAEQVAYYRLLENPNVSVSELVTSLSTHCHQQVRGRHVLAISDSSEINLHHHGGRLKPEGQGVVGNNRDIGFFIHPTLVVDGTSGVPLGLSTVQLWRRPPRRTRCQERDYQSQPIEEKESYKWIQAAQGSMSCFQDSQVAEVTYIGDSEADIYEPWFHIPAPQVHLLVRACKNRRLANSPLNLFAYLACQPIEDYYEVDVPGDPRIGRTARLALSVALKVLQLTLGRDTPNETADLVFDPTQQACLNQIAPTLDGRTTKQQNPYPPGSLAWVAWLIARLGGWSGYHSQRFPGIVTLYRGLRQFKAIFIGWHLAHP